MQKIVQKKEKNIIFKKNVMPNLMIGNYFHFQFETFIFKYLSFKQCCRPGVNIWLFQDVLIEYPQLYNHT